LYVKIWDNGDLTVQQLDDKYLDKIKDVSYEPVFILGLHRSGTSILYKILNETKKVNIFNLYQQLYYDEIIHNHINKLEDKKKQEINGLLTNKGIIDRKTDRLKVDADFAQEYFFLFINKNLPSTLDESNKNLFDKLCRKIKYISGNDYSILLKNPEDFSNFLYIKKLRPNAKFIFINRNPLNVIDSIMRLWKTHLGTKNEFLGIYYKKYNELYDNPLSRLMFRKYYLPPLSMGLFHTIRRCTKAVNYYLDNRGKLDKHDYISIRYEDLCNNPKDTQNKILSYLNIKSDIDFSDFIKPRNIVISKNIHFMKNYIYNKMKSYFKDNGYTLEV
jgi:hypothetical protein